MQLNKSTFFFLNLMLLISFKEVQASQNKLLQCLAKEEERIHKNKVHFSQAKLNQDLVNELASSNDILIKEKYLEEICNNPSFPPSVNLLRHLLIYENEIYDLRFTGLEESMKSFKISYINEFKKQVPNIFITYVSSINAQMPDAYCLERHIPEIKKFNEKVKYLEDELTINDLIKDKKQIKAIFNKLTSAKKIKEKCIEENRKKEKSK